MTTNGKSTLEASEDVAGEHRTKAPGGGRPDAQPLDSAASAGQCEQELPELAVDEARVVLAGDLDGDGASELLPTDTSRVPRV